MDTLPSENSFNTHTHTHKEKAQALLSKNFIVHKSYMTLSQGNSEADLGGGGLVRSYRATFIVNKDFLPIPI